jgi:hypothetical protein
VRIFVNLLGRCCGGLQDVAALAVAGGGARTVTFGLSSDRSQDN